MRENINKKLNEKQEMILFKNKRSGITGSNKPD
jgi:hypothetical protein